MSVAKEPWYQITDEAASFKQYQPFIGAEGTIKSMSNLRHLGVAEAYAWVEFGSRMTLIPTRFLRVVDESRG